ncbi:MAG: PIG-L family deacetylase [archaeon]|nr:PIG-L family deacetylase [archaeon]
MSELTVLKGAEKMKVLVVGAHPDDEILGVGGTICKHVSDGDDVYVCIVTKAHEPKWSKEYIAKKIQEQKKVDKLLKIKKRFNLDFPTIKLNEIAHGEINKKITEIVEKVNPDIVYTNFWGDLNQDHAMVFNGTMVAVRPPKKIRLLCYETLSETEWGVDTFRPNFWVDITKFLKKKISAFEIYKSEVKKNPHPRSAKGIQLLSGKRGSEICTENAEAFMIIRETW